MTSDMRIVRTDEGYDLAYASHHGSRFGVYLRQRAAWFDDDGQPVSPVLYADAAWKIANGPIMSPGYVRVRPDIWAVTCSPADAPGVLSVEVDVRIPWPATLRGREALTGWRSWELHPDYGSELLVPCEGNGDRTALLFSTKLLVPIPEELLPTPTAGVDIEIAKCAVDVICRQVNAVAGPVLEDITTTLGSRR